MFGNAQRSIWWVAGSKQPSPPLPSPVCEVLNGNQLLHQYLSWSPHPYFPIFVKSYFCPTSICIAQHCLSSHKVGKSSLYFMARYRYFEARYRYFMAGYQYFMDRYQYFVARNLYFEARYRYHIHISQFLQNRISVPCQSAFHSTQHSAFHSTNCLAHYINISWLLQNHISALSCIPQHC